MSERDFGTLQEEMNYLGSCHAATLEYDGRLASMSCSRLLRLVRIGERMLRSMSASSDKQRLLAAIGEAKARLGVAEDE